MKKFIILILCITMLISVFPTASFATGINDTPIIILKMDDYTSKSDNVANYEKTFEILQEKGIKASFGVIGSYLEESSEYDMEAFWNNTRRYLDYGIQFWSHGYKHAGTEFNGGLTVAEAEANFKKTLDLFKENTGVDITCFGAPENKLNQDCFAMIDEKFPQIKSMFKATDITESTDDVFVMENRVNVEASGSPSFEYFKTNYSEVLGHDYVFLQLHVGGYNDAEREELRKIIDFLQEKGTVFMTPDEYLERRNLAITSVRVTDDGRLKYTIAGTQLIANSSQLQVEIKSAETGEAIYTDSFIYDGTKYLTLDPDIERDPGKKYILCISIMEDDSSIYSAEYEFYEIVSDSPIIILKVDDLSLTSWKGVGAFKKMYAVIQEEDVTASFGIIGARATDPTSSYWADVKNWIDNGIEIWSHGYLHGTSGSSEFAGYYETEAEMEEAFKATLDLVKENTGYDITCFGAPGNNMNSAAIKMINEKFPQITSIFFPSNGTPNAVAMSNRFSTGLDGSSFTLDNFKEIYNPGLDYAVIQLHANNFYTYNDDNTVKDNYVENFRDVIQFLKEDGCTFMTPSQYVDYVRLTSSDEDAEITAVAKNNAVIGENGLNGSVELEIFSEKASNANVVAAVFDGSTFLTASVTDVALARGANVKTITLPAALTEDNTSYDVKFYLWKKATLAPLAQPVAINVVPKQVETVTYTLYASPNGTTAATSANQSLYVANYSWNSSLNTAATRETTGKRARLGHIKGSQTRCSVFLRFPLPVLANGEVVKSAKLVTTFEKAGTFGADMTVRAYAFSPTAAFGEAFAMTDFNDFNTVTANELGSTIVPTTATAGHKIEIDVTEHVKTRSGNADFVLSAPEIATVNNLYIYSVDGAVGKNNIPVLVIETEK